MPMHTYYLRSTHHKKLEFTDFARQNQMSPRGKLLLLKNYSSDTLLRKQTSQKWPCDLQRYVKVTHIQS